MLVLAGLVGALERGVAACQPFVKSSSLAGRQLLYHYLSFRHTSHLSFMHCIIYVVRGAHIEVDVVAVVVDGDEAHSSSGLGCGCVPNDSDTPLSDEAWRAFI